MTPFEIVYLDVPFGDQIQGKSHGTFYDRPYQPGSGKTRHPLGHYRVVNRYLIRARNPRSMLAVRLFFDTGERATGKCANKHPYRVAAYLKPGKGWNDDARS